MFRAIARRPGLSSFAAAATVGTSGYLWYSRASNRADNTHFDVSIKVTAPDGSRMPTLRKIAFLPSADVETRLTENAVSKSVHRHAGPRWKYDTACVAANDPIEDANAQIIVKRNPVPNVPPGDLMFFAVMDGHAGPYTSRLLSKILIPSVALELSSLISQSPPPPSTTSLYTWLKSFIIKPPLPLPAANAYDAGPNLIAEGIKAAFKKIDQEIVAGPLRVLSSLPGSTDDKPSYQHLMALPSMLPALSGSCALLALLDTAKNDMYVACTGDSRAVAGYWDEQPDGTGKWRVEVLTEDQTGRNPNELKRMQSEHPPEESSFVIQRGRVLGGLEPTRAFGDSRYKWSRDEQQKLNEALLEPDAPRRQPPRDFKTPPYVTSEPVVTHRKLSLPSFDSPSQSPSPSQPKSTLRFIVLATDGLWDELSSSEVVSLVGGYLHNRTGAVSKSELAATVVETPDAAGVQGKDARRNGKGDLKAKWAFVDTNVGTHLIRNAFGGADEMAVRKMLSIPAPLARRFRDDVTVTVVWWEDADVPGADVRRPEQVRAKL
ncbi:hypothetical protein BOTBODRAFT_117905 [Botryobasidium botryosum FD-172 SS1]|uniref:PPM-type phosphatase domain-containing protein n=1 Tax=Botryobasidium botryosum (strain FD-172 SS1) TaxID=930990 RepID=A0A067MBE8_BOTB1|nr:hypothetical protein BOTBODRAFT_117905 [Botryobasidium botryosum FD-172 SS1]